MKVNLLSIFLAVILGFSALSVLAEDNLKVSPGRIRITVKKVPGELSSLAIPVSIDTNIATIKRVTSSLNGALAVFGANSEGVGIVSTKGFLPPKFKISVEFNAVSNGTTDVSIGEAVDKIGGEKIDGIIAKSSAKTLKVKSKKK